MGERQVHAQQCDFYAGFGEFGKNAVFQLKAVVGVNKIGDFVGVGRECGVEFELIG